VVSKIITGPSTTFMGTSFPLTGPLPVEAIFQPALTLQKFQRMGRALRTCFFRDCQHLFFRAT
jgi:hypothetical protein